ncbi:hypothetical protein ABW21_db0204388 [Orbilia brochopaga]|nr:hypothetical protein ABW21_db0204388 [Drechslerella brochopaga]
MTTPRRVYVDDGLGLLEHIEYGDETPAPAKEDENQLDSETAGEDLNQIADSADNFSMIEEMTTETDDAADIAAVPVQQAKKGQKGQGGKGRRGKGSKKSGDKTKQPASKKRKTSHAKDDGNEENENPNEQTKEEPEDGEGNAKPRGRGRAKGDTTEAWTDDHDKGLLDILKRHTKNELNSIIPWKNVYADYIAAHPEPARTLLQVKARWFNVLKHGTIELTDEQMTHFKQAVKDINGSEKNAAIAWRYQQISGPGASPLTKGTVANLLKSLSIKS